MSAQCNEVSVGIAEQIGGRLAEIDARHQAILRQHDRLRRELDEAIAAKDVAALAPVWQRYKGVVVDLDEVTSEIETLRLYTV
jgi:hypothetical protein